MLKVWTHNPTFKGIPIVFTEDNYSDQGNNVTAYEAAYMVDLFTWLHNHTSYGIAASSPIRVQWYRGVDDGEKDGGNNLMTLGLYAQSGGAGSVKLVDDGDPNQAGITYCPHVPQLRS